MAKPEHHLFEKTDSGHHAKIGSFDHQVVSPPTQSATNERNAITQATKTMVAENKLPDVTLFSFSDSQRRGNQAQPSSTGANGERVTNASDNSRPGNQGQRSTTGPNGETVTNYPNGNVLTVHPDGSRDLLRPGGFLSSHEPSSGRSTDIGTDNRGVHYRVRRGPNGTEISESVSPGLTVGGVPGPHTRETRYDQNGNPVSFHVIKPEGHGEGGVRGPNGPLISRSADI